MRWFSQALDLVFPPTALEGGRAPQSTGFGADAWSRVRFIEAPVCDGCGAPFEYDRGEGVLCLPCEGSRRAFARCRAACLYDEHSRDLILQYKHADRTELSALFAHWLGRAAADLLEDCDAVAPVPLHPLRLLSRRFNQAAEIARPLAAASGLAYLPDVLVRRRNSTQAGRSGSGRRRAVSGAFAVPDGRRKRIEGRRILLVDDVFTTGATADACARVLVQAGARAVDVAVIARVRTTEDVSI